jgi:hypothetical protein
VDLNKKIENKKAALYHSIDSKGILHQRTINLSQQLDKLIVKRMTIALSKV